MDGWVIYRAADGSEWEPTPSDGKVWIVGRLGEMDYTSGGILDCTARERRRFALFFEAVDYVRSQLPVGEA